MGSEMREKLHRMILQQQKKFLKSLRDDKKVWQDLYSFGTAYKKELNELFNSGKKKVAE